MAARRRLPRLLDHPARLQSVLRLALDESYVLDAASGNIVGDIDGTTLAAAGTPTYRREAAGRAGVYYDGSGDRHTADVHPIGTGSAWLAAIFEPVAGAGALLSSCAGRLTAAARGLALYLQTNGNPTALVRDNTPTTVTATATGDIRAAGGVWLAQMQIDRAANALRTHWSRLGGGAGPLTDAKSIAAIGTLTIASQVFGSGSFGALAHGNAVYWIGVATGAQCDGDGLLALVSGRMGFG